MTTSENGTQANEGTQTGALTEDTRATLNEMAQRYPQARSALLPMLHYIQSELGYVSTEGIAMCAEVLGLTNAEVAGVTTFYTMYQRRPAGKYHLGVCINPGCGMLGGDEIYEALSEYLGIDTEEVSQDGLFSLERIECQAACTHAPVMTANWEYLDDMTVEKAKEIIEKLRAGETVHSTRGPAIRSYKETEKTLAGFEDGLAHEGPGADEKMLTGLNTAKEHGFVVEQPGLAAAMEAGQQ